MKYRLLDLLVCPSCKGNLECEVFSKTTNNLGTLKAEVLCQKICSLNRINLIDEKNEKIDCAACYDIEIEEGLLTCQCGLWFPIISCIPRMLLSSLREEMLVYHRDFFEKHKDRFPGKHHYANDYNKVDNAKRKTLKSFSYQWNIFSEMYDVWKKNFDNYIFPLEPSDFKGKLVLDGGCGFGRHIFYAAQYGAETVGVDLSEAVEAAYKNTKSLGNIHIIQADIYHLPFRKVFDLIYCIGVLQHLPSAKEGFLKLADILKPGSTLFVWVYGKRKGIYNLMIPKMRVITTKLPHWFLYLLTFIFALLSHLLISLAYKILIRIPFLKNLAKNMPFTSYAKYPFRVSQADWFDRLSVPITNYFKKKDVSLWFDEARLQNVEILNWKGTSWKGLGISPIME